MATFDYSGIQGSALSLLNKFGRNDIELRRSVGGTIDGVSGEVTGAADRVGTITAVLLPATADKIRAFGEHYKEKLIRGSIKFVIADAKTAPFQPLAGDRIKFDNVEWEVMGDTPVDPSSDAIIYKMGVRKR
jgi:hypothetical protein